MSAARKRTLLKIIILGDSGYVHIYICIYVYVCVCVCVLQRECRVVCGNGWVIAVLMGERERERERLCMCVNGV